jgi:hypothetical protein
VKEFHARKITILPANASRENVGIVVASALCADFEPQVRH